MTRKIDLVLLKASTPTVVSINKSSTRNILGNYEKSRATLETTIKSFLCNYKNAYCLMFTKKTFVPLDYVLIDLPGGKQIFCSVVEFV